MKKYKKACLSSFVSRRGSQETLNQKGFMMVKNKHSKRLPFLKNGVYAKDTMSPPVPRLREHGNDSRDCKNFSAILQHFLSVTLIAMLPALLSGCMGVYEGGFECPAGAGVGCKSISEVNDLVNAGELTPKTPSPISAQESKTQESEAQKPEVWYSPSFIREHVKRKRTYGKVPS